MKIQELHHFNDDDINEINSRDIKTTEKIIKIHTVLPFDEWPDPIEIDETLLPVLALTDAMLPESLRDRVKDIGYRKCRPADVGAISTLLMLSSVIGCGCGIRPNRLDNWHVFPILWSVIIGPPGTMKTPIVAEALEPLSQLEEEASKLYEEEHKKYSASITIKKAQTKALEKKMSTLEDQSQHDQLASLYNELLAQYPQEPILKRYRTNDTTREKLVEILSENPRGVLIERDELMGLLASFEKKGNEEYRNFYLEGWSFNKKDSFDRKNSGATRFNKCISILGTTQPSKILQLLKKGIYGSDNDGMIQRFQLMIYPNEPETWNLIEQAPNFLAAKRVINIVTKLAKINFLEYGALDDRDGKGPFFRFDSPAQESFNQWLTRLSNVTLKNKNEPPILIEHLSKYRSLMPNLALIFHLVKVADNICQPGSVGLESVQEAVEFCKYLESHARRIYGLVLSPSNMSFQARALANRVMSGNVRNGFCYREIIRKRWQDLNRNSIKNAGEFNKICDELIELGWLKEKELEENQRNKRYDINPKLLNKNI